MVAILLDALPYVGMGCTYCAMVLAANTVQYVQGTVQGKAVVGLPSTEVDTVQSTVQCPRGG